MEIRNFEPADFAFLQQWVTSPELLFQYSGDHFRFPLNVDQVMEYRNEHPDRPQYVGLLDTIPVAFGEIIPQDCGWPRLGRILIGDPSVRGKGLGHRFVAALVVECVRLYGCGTVDLNVWDENIAARRCYEKAGFVFQQNEQTVVHAFDRDFNIHRMVWQPQQRGFEKRV